MIKNWFSSFTVYAQWEKPNDVKNCNRRINGIQFYGLKG